MIRRSLLLITLLLTTTISYSLEKVNQRLLDYAKACPKVKTSSVPSLVGYLKAGAVSDAQMVEVFCYWITENIGYDTDKLNGKNSATSSNILSKRKGVCSNYAELLQEMCTSARIECYSVDGYSKGYSYVKNKTFTKADHAWNVVRVKGKYQFIDLTWASGYVSFDKNVHTFHKKLDIKEIFSDSNYFALEHLPADPRWQLRIHPITINGFNQNDSVNAMLKTHLSYYNYNDSIRTYIQADSIHQIVLAAEGAYRFNPISATIRNLASAYYNFAWYNCDHFSDVSHFDLAIIWYNKAIVYYGKLNNDEGKKWINNAQKGIDYCNFKLKELIKPK